MSLGTDTLPSKDLSNGHSHFSAGSKITGELQVPGLVELLGHVDGKISADAVMIEEVGSMEGELYATKIAIKGQFEGRIFGGTVILHSSARISGEIRYETLSIENGAQVNSRCAIKKPA